MELTPNPEKPAEKTSFKAILDRVAEPFAIFSVALFALLLVAQIGVLPLFNTFDLSGQKLNPTQLSQYKAQLVQKVNDAESARNDLILPIKNETYHLLQARKDALAPIATVKAALESAASHQLDAREELSLCHANAGGGGFKHALGLRDVRTTLQQVTRHASRHAGRCVECS